MGPVAAQTMMISAARPKALLLPDHTVTVVESRSNHAERLVRFRAMEPPPRMIGLESFMALDALTPQAPPLRSRNRPDIHERFKWDVADIFPSWAAWEAGYKTLEAGVDRYAALKGTLASGPAALLEAF